MHQILAEQEMASQIKLVKIHAPDIAEKAKPGQFVIIRTDEKGERIPLTLVDWEKNEGSITLIFQEVGVSTRKLGALKVGEKIQNVLGPLGTPSDIKSYASVAFACGGVGTAAAYPIAKAFKKQGTKVVSIVGARSENLIILENEMKNVSDEFFISTDDGSKGHKGFVSDVLKSLIENGHHFDVVYVIGPAIMMKVTSEVTRTLGIKTMVSLNPIMVDGMGMCGVCRCSVGGQTKFACVDGPEFDAHQVDFGELLKRLRMYCPEERIALQGYEESRGNQLGSN